MTQDAGPSLATVLFTDLVGSSALRAALGEERADELRRLHDRLLTERVNAHHGRVLKSTGDGLVAAFASASDALSAAVEMQQALERARATESHDTLLERAFIPDGYVALVCPTGLRGAGLFQLSMFAWALLGFAAVYDGVARRAYDLTVAAMPKRTSVALLTRTMAHHPEVQHYVAEMRLGLEAMGPVLASVAGDWSAGVDHGGNWPVKIVAAKHFVTTTAFQVTDRALDLSGGAGIFTRNRIEQLFRDCRLGRVHPANELLTHELVGKFSLGLDFDDPQRWG